MVKEDLATQIFLNDFLFFAHTLSKMFDENWKYDFFIENMDGNAQCIVLYIVIALYVVMLFFIKRHYEASHVFFDSIKGNDRNLKLL